MTESDVRDTTTTLIKRTRGRVEKTCQRCGSDFRVPPSATYAKFCSLACTRNRVRKQCLRCGAIFEVIPARKDTARYCSRACFSNRKSGTCETCGVTFDYPASEGERRFCSIACKADSQRKTAPDRHIGKSCPPLSRYALRAYAMMRATLRVLRADY